MEFGLDKRDKCGMMKFNNMKLFVTVNIEGWSLRNVVSSETCKFNTRIPFNTLVFQEAVTQFQGATTLVVKTQSIKEPSTVPAIGCPPLMFIK